MQPFLFLRSAALAYISLHDGISSVAVMVAVVQLVEHQVVILGVAGSSPVSHPKDKP